MREVMITQILYGFDQKNQFFSGVVLIQVQQFKTGIRYGPEILQLWGKQLKLRVKSVEGN